MTSEIIVDRNKKNHGLRVKSVVACRRRGRLAEIEKQSGGLAEELEKGSHETRQDEIDFFIKSI